MVVGGTATGVFALKADTGEIAWEKQLIRQPSEEVDMAKAAIRGVVPPK